MKISKKTELLKILFIIVVIGILCTCSRFIKAEASYTDFEIMNDEILIGYSGSGGDVVIPDGITEINSGAFSGCSSITGIEIPDSVTIIGDGAFEYCTNLSKVKLPGNIARIGGAVFVFCSSLTEIKIPDGVKEIGNCAFANTGLKNIEIPDSVEKIGDAAFTGNINLLEIQVDKNNPYYVSVDGILFNRGMTALIQCPACKKIKEYNIPSSVTSIGNAAFDGCQSIEKIKIHKNVTDIGYNSFGGCGMLAEIQVDKNNPGYISDNGILFSKNKDKLLQYPAGRKEKEYVVPYGVKYINWGAFGDCTELEVVEIPDSVISIDSYAFSGCAGLIAVAIPDSVKDIDMHRGFIESINTADGNTGDIVDVGLLQDENSVFSGTNKDLKIYCHMDSYICNYLKKYKYNSTVVNGDIAAAMRKELGLEKKGELSLKKKKMVLQQNQKSKIKIISKLNTEVIYKSLDTSIAIVNKKGVVTAKKKGKTTILVNANGRQRKIKVTVKAEALSVKLNKNLKLSKTKVTITKGKKLTIKKASGISGKVTFKSLDKKIASVSVKGVIKARKRGRTTILIKTKKKTVKLKVTVKR